MSSEIFEITVSKSKGLPTKALGLQLLSMMRLSALALIIITGVFENAAVFFKELQTSIPDHSGNITSRIKRSAKNDFV